MRAHWDAVEQCAGLLAFCTTPYDNNGIDLCFMISEDKKNAGNSDPITKRIRKNIPPSADSKPAQRANINAVLGKVLGKYQDKLRATFGGPKRHSHNSLISPRQRLKKLILFVLTDGLWGQHSDAKRPISDLVRAIVESGRLPNQVGIQFIRFGDDESGKRRLTELDDFQEP
jgi:hypothetical protein